MPILRCRTAFRFPGGTGPSLPLRWAYRCRCWTGTIANVALAYDRGRLADFTGFFDLGRQCLPAGDRRLFAGAFVFGRFDRLSEDLSRGLIVFTLASLGCVLSRSLAELTVARTVQGFGAAAVSSVNTALIRVIYPRRYLGRGMGINALVVAVSAAAGPPWPPACCRSLRGHGFSPSICRSACWPPCWAAAFFRAIRRGART